jgi:hypothetical protein
MEIETETDCELNVITSVNLITKMSTHQIYINIKQIIFCYVISCLPKLIII